MGKGNYPNLIDDETGLERFSGLPKVTQLFTLSSRAETGSSGFTASLFLLPWPPSHMHKATVVMSDGYFVSMLQT